MTVVDIITIVIRTYKQYYDRNKFVIKTTFDQNRSPQFIKDFFSSFLLRKQKISIPFEAKVLMSLNRSLVKNHKKKTWPWVARWF